MRGATGHVTAWDVSQVAGRDPHGCKRRKRSTRTGRAAELLLEAVLVCAPEVWHPTEQWSATAPPPFVRFSFLHSVQKSERSRTEVIS